MKKTKNENNIIQMPIRANKTEQEWFNLHVEQILRKMTPMSRDVALHMLHDLKSYTMPLYPNTLIGPVFFEYKESVEDAMVRFDYSYEEDPFWTFLKNQFSALGHEKVIGMVQIFLKNVNSNTNRRAV